MISPQAFLAQMLKNNPQLQQNPITQNYLSVLQSGDAKKGEELAQNLLNSYGMTKEQALEQAKTIFHLG